MKTKSRTKSSPKPRLRLPSLAAFKDLPLRERTNWFLKWVKRQKGDYNYWDDESCPLGRFGQAISRRSDAIGGWNTFLFGFPREEIEVGGNDGVLVDDMPRTYPALAQRLAAHLKATA